MALFEVWNQNEFRNPLLVTRQKLMEGAKISGLATFHKCIKDLNEFGHVFSMGLPETHQLAVRSVW
jgi:hypothetical protein